MSIGMQTPLQTNRQVQFLWGGPRAEVLEYDMEIDSTAADSASWNTKILRGGLLMGKITSSGRLKEFDLASSDGSQNLFGITKEESELIDRFARAKNDFKPVITKAPIKAAEVLYKGVTIVGHASEYAIRAALRNQGFRLDDEVGALAAPSGVLNLRQRFTIAEVNAGATILAAVAGLKYRLLSASAIAVGGAAGAVTTVDILATQSASSVKLVAFAQASLTQNTQLTSGGSGAAILAGGLSYVQNDVNTAVTIGKTGSSVTTATHIDVLLTYELAP